MNILCLLPTRSLLPLTLTSRRIHDVILRIIHNRLLTAASLVDHQVVLECYHPSAKNTTPYYACEYLGTDSLSDSCPDSQESCTLGQLRGLYSHFRPARPLGTHREYDGELVSHNIDLESYELFSQLQSDVSMVKVGTRNGFFLNCITIAEGLTRVWRNWLGEQAKKSLPSNSTQQESTEDYKKRLLWSSLSEHTGLRLRVEERKDIPAPVIQRRSGEEENVSYTLFYEGLSTPPFCEVISR